MAIGLCLYSITSIESVLAGILCTPAALHIYLLTYLLNFISTKTILGCMYLLYFILGNVHNVQFFVEVIL